MTSPIHQMYINLEKCTEALEEDVEKSLKQLNNNVGNENVMVLESSKNYHYNEILSQLKLIKDHIKTIAKHNESIVSLQSKIDEGNKTAGKIDKNYIKKQVETFQQFGVVHKRERKPPRRLETSSMKFLECWERILEAQEPPFSDTKTDDLPRKHRRLLSSTVDSFLDVGNKSRSLDSLLEREDVEAFNDKIINKGVDTKPRIVDVVYKKNINGHV